MLIQIHSRTYNLLFKLVDCISPVNTTNAKELFLKHVCPKVSNVYIYSNTSLNRPPAGVNSCCPFREGVDLQNFAKYREHRVFVILVLWKAGRYREGVDL